MSHVLANKPRFMVVLVRGRRSRIMGETDNYTLARESADAACDASGPGARCLVYGRGERVVYEARHGASFNGRSNPSGDDELRALERAALTGDRAAAEKLRNLRLRTGKKIGLRRWEMPLARLRQKRSFVSPNRFEARFARAMEGLEALSVGKMEGCRLCEGLDESGTEGFSWRPCHTCGSKLGGDREAAHALVKGAGFGREPEHLSVCYDCVAYIANGEVPEETRENPLIMLVGNPPREPDAFHAQRAERPAPSSTRAVPRGLSDYSSDDLRALWRKIAEEAFATAVYVKGRGNVVRPGYEERLREIGKVLASRGERNPCKNPSGDDELRALERAAATGDRAAQDRLARAKKRAGMARGPGRDYVKRFVQGYLESALWSTNDETTPEGGVPLDENYSVEDVSPEAKRGAIQYSIDFIRANWDDLRESKLSPEYAGQDFWLTRNGHGTGFWDRGLGAVGDRLAKAAKVYGSVNFYVDDGLVRSDEELGRRTKGNPSFASRVKRFFTGESKPRRSAAKKTNRHGIWRDPKKAKFWGPSYVGTTTVAEARRRGVKGIARAADGRITFHGKEVQDSDVVDLCDDKRPDDVAGFAAAPLKRIGYGNVRKVAPGSNKEKNDWDHKISQSHPTTLVHIPSTGQTVLVGSMQVDDWLREPHEARRRH